jgi:cobaltochelatase CobS
MHNNIAPAPNISANAESSVGQQAAQPQSYDAEISRPLVPCRFPLKATFGISDQAVPDSAAVLGFEPGHIFVPKVDSDYYFSQEKMREMIAFLGESRKGGMVAMKLFGDPSTGKTSIILQVHARLNMPLLPVPCHASMEEYHLIGRLVPQRDGNLKWVDGPVLMAARHGFSVLLDEYNTLDPATSTMLNMLLEGYPIMIAETGEVIRPHANFKVFATENNIDSRLSVAGRNVQDVANDDRWMVAEVDYLAQEVEKQMIVNRLVKLGFGVADSEVRASLCSSVAHKTREAFRAGETAIDRPLSTRTVVRWARLVSCFARDPLGPAHAALRRSIKMSEEMDTVVAEYIKVAL